MRILVLACLLGACSREPAPLRVGAAAVLRDAMPDLVRAHGAPIDVLYGASDRVAASSVDVMIVADKSLVAAGTPTTIATTSLVLVGTKGAAHTFKTLRESGVISIGDPASVPVGRYAKRYLDQLGGWDAVAPRIVLGGDVAAVLALAQRGTADVAIVYAADVADAAPLVELDRAADGPRVELVATTSHARGNAFVTFLQTPAARTILARHGFAPP